MVPELTSRTGLSNQAHTNQRPHLESNFTKDFKDTGNQDETKQREVWDFKDGSSGPSSLLGFGPLFRNNG